MIYKLLKGLDILSSSKLTKRAINILLKRYATVHDFRIDRKNHKISISITLKGETTPINIEITEYYVDNNKLIVKNYTTNKEWLNNIFDDFIKDKEFQLSKDFKDFL